MNKIMVFNAKGGVGKTAIALNLALTDDYGIVTNDLLSVVDQILPEEKNIILDRHEPLPEIPSDWKIIFDFGGYPDARALEAMWLSEYILIPVLPREESMQTSLDLISEIIGKERVSKIILVVNQTKGDQYETYKNIFNHYYPELKVFNIKQSAALPWMFKHKISIEQLCQRFPLFTRHFTPVAEQFNDIMEYIDD